MGRSIYAVTDPATRQLADALWDGVRHTPPLPRGGGGWRGWYLDGPYASVVERRRRRVWQHRPTEPWLTAQWLLDRGRSSRSYLRYEGLPGQHSYEGAYEAVRDGRFSRPFLFVAGYSRSGTTSLQNLVLAAFPDHVPPGRWSDPGHPLRLWWYPKHNAVTAHRVATSGAAQVILSVRPFIDSAASLALYEGRTDPADVTALWVREQVESWVALAEVAHAPGVVVVPFSWLPTTTPAGIVAYLSSQIGIDASSPVDADTSWEDVYDDRISHEELDNPYLSNLPHDERPVMTARLRARIADLLGPDAEEIDRVHRDALAAVGMIAG